MRKLISCVFGLSLVMSAAFAPAAQQLQFRVTSLIASSAESVGQ